MTGISRRSFLVSCFAAIGGMAIAAMPNGTMPVVAAVGLESGFLIAEEQKAGSFVVIDGRKEGVPAWSWEWNPARDPGIPKSEVHDFRAPSDGKVLATSAGPSLLAVSSGGSFAEVSFATGRAICYGKVGGNPHSIAKLPGEGLYAIASSVSHAVTVVDVSGNPFAPEKQHKAVYPLKSAHGVEWDGARYCLWALGGTNLVRFAFDVSAKTLQPVSSHDFRPVGGDGGHDLSPDGAGGYFLTTAKNLLHFDPEIGAFVRVCGKCDIKSFSRNPAWGDAYVVVREAWWSDRILVRAGDKERVIGPYPGARFYKARWMK